MAKAVVCIVNSEEKAAKIVNDLRSAGFSSNDVSVLLPGQRGHP